MKVRIIEDALPFPSLNDLNETGGGTNINENGSAMFFSQINETKEQNESDKKLDDHKGTSFITEDNVDKLAVHFQDNAGRPIGARRRKSGSVKRFKQDPTPCTMNDDTQGVMGRVTRSCSVAGKIGVQNLDFLRNGKNICAITEIIKPISYSASKSRSGHDVSLTFAAKRFVILTPLSFPLYFCD